MSIPSRAVDRFAHTFQRLSQPSILRLTFHFGEPCGVVGLDRSDQYSRPAILQMGAEQLEFPDTSFDCVLCGFALWFFPHPGRALREFIRVLNPGGRLTLTTWTDDCPFLVWCEEQLSTCLPNQPSRRGQGPRFDTPARLDAALREGGFEAIEIDVEEEAFVYADDAAWWDSLWSHGIRRRLEVLDPPTLHADAWTSG